jgi:hypothetical protein
MTPNGQRLAWIDHRFAKPRVVMFDVAARKELRVFAVPESFKARGIVWNDNEKGLDHPLRLLIGYRARGGAVRDEDWNPGRLDRVDG